ncbi:MAG: BamA/TamA family outer membrane protein, partial [Longimicrobiales bacterium]
LKHQIQDQGVTRLNFILGQRNIQYLKRSGLNGLKGSLDIPVGRELDLTVGKGVNFLSTDDVQNEKDLFFNLRGYGAIAPGRWILTSSFSLQGRMIEDSSKSGWKDLLGEFDIYTSWQPEVTPRHTLFARISGSGGWKATTPFQLSLGGFSTLRGYRLGHSPGAKLLIATIEDRIYLGSPGDGLMDLGMTGFLDLGSMWAGDVPFGSDSGLQASAGAGIRIGLPSGSKDVVRIDVAVPINGPTAFSGPTFRITAYEMLGFLRGFGDDEMRRSQRVGGGLKLISNSSSSF